MVNIQFFSIVVAFSSNSFPGKTSLPVKNSYLPTFPDDKAKILTISLCKLYFIRFYDRLFLNLSTLSDDKVLLSTKNENDCLVQSLFVNS